MSLDRFSYCGVYGILAFFVHISHAAQVDRIFEYVPCLVRGVNHPVPYLQVQTPFQLESRRVQYSIHMTLTTRFLRMILQFLQTIPDCPHLQECP